MENHEWSMQGRAKMTPLPMAYGALGVFGALFGELGWKTPIFCWRESGPEKSERIAGAAVLARLDALWGELPEGAAPGGGGEQPGG